jgi:hypothetical protein
MPEISVARTIAVVRLDGAARTRIRNGDLQGGLEADLFAPDDQEAMSEVKEYVGQLSETQADLLLLALQHAIDEEQGHEAGVQFLQLNSSYEMNGIGLEIRNDTVVEEKMISPIRVMFVRWSTPES